MVGRVLLLSQGIALPRSDLFDLYSAISRTAFNCSSPPAGRWNQERPGPGSRDWNVRLARSAEQLWAPVTNGRSSINALRTCLTLSSEQRDGARRAREALIGSVLPAEQQAGQLELLAEAGVSAGDLELVDRTHPEQLILLRRPTQPLTS